MIHILPHWNWPDRVGQPIRVSVYSNAEAVELFLNGASLGRQSMARNGHLEWQVPYKPGTLIARGYTAGREVASDKVETTGPMRRLKLEPYRAALAADGRDATMVKVSVVDAQGRVVPTGDAQVNFSVEGPLQIIGVANGDPGSHEADKVTDDITSQAVRGWRLADGLAGVDPSQRDGLQWRNPFQWYPPGEGPKTPDAFILRGEFEQSPTAAGAQTTLFLPVLNPRQRVLVAGQDLTARLQPAGAGLSLSLAGVALASGPVEVLIVVPDEGAASLKVLDQIGGGGSNVAFVQRRIPAPPWRRSLFSGYAQVVVQAADGSGPATVRATAPGLEPATATLRIGSPVLKN
jgi:beta-galactosidase